MMPELNLRHLRHPLPPLQQPRVLRQRLQPPEQHRHRLPPPPVLQLQRQLLPPNRQQENKLPAIL